MSRRLIVLAAFLAIAPAGCTSWQGVHFNGPLCFMHPIPKPGAQVEQVCHAVPDEARDHVHVYAVNGADPLYLGNLGGMCDRLKALGFRHTTCGQMTATWPYRRQIRAVKAKDPDARIVLVGYSAGANCVRGLAHDLADDGVPVDLLVYLGGDTIRNTPYSRPANVGQVLTINAHGFVLLGYDLYFRGPEIDGQSNHRIDCRHILLPSRPQTMELLVQHLVMVTQPANPPQRPRVEFRESAGTEERGTGVQPASGFDDNRALPRITEIP